jgi:hypothetical protein
LTTINGCMEQCREAESNQRRGILRSDNLGPDTISARSAKPTRSGRDAGEY